MTTHTFSLKSVNDEGTALESGICDGSGRLPSEASSGNTFYIKKPGQGVPFCFFVEGCGFTFTLVIEDSLNTEITDDCEYTPTFTIYNSSEDVISSSFAWDADLEAWLVNIDNPDDTDPDGYFITYNATPNGVLSQYPRKYKTGDKFNPDDLIKPGSYEGIIPFFKLGAEVVIQGTPSPTDCPVSIWPQFESGYFLVGLNDTFSKSRQIESSVDYIVYTGVYNAGWTTPVYARGGGDCALPFSCYSGIIPPIGYDVSVYITWSVGGESHPFGWYGTVRDEVENSSYISTSISAGGTTSIPSPMVGECLDYTTPWPFDRKPNPAYLQFLAISASCLGVSAAVNYA